MAIIKDVEQAKEFLGKVLNTATGIEGLRAFFEEAEEVELTRALGSEFVAELREMTVTSENEPMFRVIRRAVAWYGYLKYLPFSVGSDGDYGLTEQSNDGAKSVRIGILDKRIREAGENASSSIERVLNWAFANRAQFESLDSYLSERECPWFRSAGEFTRYLPQVAGSHRLFISLQPYMLQVEDELINPLLSAEFSGLRAKIAEGDSLTPEEEKIARLVKYALATGTYAKAIRHLNVVLDPTGGLRILSDFDGIYNRKAVDSRMLGQMISDAGAEAEKWNSVIRKSLRKKVAQGLPDQTKYTGFIRLK